MIDTHINNTIYPLDTRSIIQCTQEPLRDYRPLAVTIHDSQTDHVTMHINVSQCDPDSIGIDTHPTHLTITGTAHVQFLANPDSAPVTLSRPVSQTVPLPAGIDLTTIRSQLNDDHLAIHIPFQA